MVCDKMFKHVSGFFSELIFLFESNYLKIVNMATKRLQFFIVFLTTITVCKAFTIPYADEKTDSGSDESNSYSSEEMNLPKRGLSIRGDLRALARMLRFQQAKRLPFRVKQILPSHQKLINKGKRTKEDSNESTINSLEGLLASKMKRGRLSINSSLHSLSDMLAASGHARSNEEIFANKHRLIGLGK